MKDKAEDSRGKGRESAGNKDIPGRKIRVRRLSYPADEAQHPWLEAILTAHAIIDKGVAVGIEQERNKRQITLACAEGCDACCHTQTDIPVYPHELVGIFWFTTEKVLPPWREALKRQLESYAKGKACPFLLNHSCAIHLLRPAGCRQFNVFGTPCAPGEDPFFTRRHDVLTPLREYIDDAFAVMLPFYGISGREARQRALMTRFMDSQAQNLKDVDWKLLRRKMDEHDARKL